MRSYSSVGFELDILCSTRPHRPRRRSRLPPGITSSTSRARWLRPDHAASDQMRFGLRQSRPHSGDCWSIRLISARDDAIDGIAKPEVGRWPGVRRRFEPPVGSAPVARRWRPPDAPSRQAGGRRRPRLVSTTPTDRRAAIESALSAGVTGHGGLGPRRTPATSLPRPLLECRKASCSADDRGHSSGRSCSVWLHPGAVRARRPVAGRDSNAPASTEPAGRPFAVAGRVDALVMASAWLATAVTTSAATSAATS
jgi:hypothetical protein